MQFARTSKEHREMKLKEMPVWADFSKLRAAGLDISRNHSNDILPARSLCARGAPCLEVYTALGTPKASHRGVTMYLLCLPTRRSSMPGSGSMLSSSRASHLALCGSQRCGGRKKAKKIKISGTHQVWYY